MKAKTILLTGAALALGAVAAPAQPIGDGLVMYMQMGGNPGDGATLARQTGAAQAAEALGVDLKEQFSAWAPETMINQFKEAVAARPACIEIMGHPGRRRLPRRRQAGRGPGHRRHRRQLADDRPSDGVRRGRDGICRASTSTQAA